MFKPHIGSCVNCPRTHAPIVVKDGFCDRCNHKRKQDKKKAAGRKTSTPIKKYREPTGEKDVFMEVLDNLPDTETRCFVCGTRIATVTAHNFSHVLSKAPNKYPKFKLYAENIRLLCHRFIADDNGFQGCHFAWDHQPRSKLMDDPKWDKMFALEEELKMEYKQL